MTDGIEIIRKGNAVTRLTVNKQRITIKLAEKDDHAQVIDFLTNVGHAIQQDASIQVTMRGALEGVQLVMQDGLQALVRNYSLVLKG